MGPRLVGFQFGRRQEQWHMEWDLNMERHAGEFMHGVESSLGTEEVESLEINLPGSWPQSV
jgi:hypothetical protein